MAKLIGPLIVVFACVVAAFMAIEILPNTPVIADGFTPLSAAITAIIIILIVGVLTSSASKDDYPYLHSFLAIVFLILNHILMARSSNHTAVLIFWTVTFSAVFAFIAVATASHKSTVK